MGLDARKDMMKNYDGKPPLTQRFDARSQILQSARYLKYIKEKKQCNRLRCMAYYNSGMDVSDSHIAKWKKNNPAIAKYIKSGDNTVE